MDLYVDVVRLYVQAHDYDYDSDYVYDHVQVRVQSAFTDQEVSEAQGAQ